jgi:hypothetical protein
VRNLDYQISKHNSPTKSPIYLQGTLKIPHFSQSQLALGSLEINYEFSGVTPAPKLAAVFNSLSSPILKGIDKSKSVNYIGLSKKS